jgi:hypothetical protein
MNRRERRQQSLALERRILSGERKADIVGQAAVDGLDWRELARMAALIPIPANRRRWRWLNRLLMAVLVAAAAGQLAGVYLVEGGWFWLVGQLTWTVFFVLPLPWIALYRYRGYAPLMTAGVGVGAWWVYMAAWAQEVSASGTLIVVEVALCGLVAALALLTQRLLLPATTLWSDARPKLDADGNLVFEE